MRLSKHRWQFNTDGDGNHQVTEYVTIATRPIKVSHEWAWDLSLHTHSGPIYNQMKNLKMDTEWLDDILELDPFATVKVMDDITQWEKAIAVTAEVRSEDVTWLKLKWPNL
jgi:hypothetical protein